MGQRPNELTPDASPQHRWGAELRELRKGRGLALRELAKRALVDHGHLGRFERAERIPPRDQVMRLDAALDANGSLLREWDRINGNRGHVANSGLHVAKSSVALALAAPDQATSDEEGISVPCRLRDGTVVWVALDRRTLLRSGVGLGAVAAMGVGTPAAADAGAVSGLVRKSGIRSTYGPTPVERLRSIRKLLIENDNQLGPRHVIAAAREYIETISDLRRDARGADRRDLMELQTQYGEFLSWLYQDLGQPAQAQHWLDRAFQWSHTVGDADLTAYVMARKAQLAGDTADLVEVVDLAEAAQRMSRPRSRLAAVAQTYGAYGHALRGEAAASEHGIDQVRSALDSIASDPTPWGVWLNAPYVEVHRAQSLQALGRHELAADAFADAIGMLPEGYHRDRGVYLSRQAVALADARVPEQAATVGMHALSVAEDTGSGRIISELMRLDQALIPWTALSEVNAFRDAFDGTLYHQTEMEA